MQEIPVYAFTGFLDSGKTKFIQETLEDERFNAGERTLVLLFEEGEEEYGRRARAENMTGGQGREGIAWRNDGGYPLRYSFGDMPTCSRKNFPSDDWLLKCRSLAISFMVFVVLRSRRRISSDV